MTDLSQYRRKGAFLHFIGCGGAGTRPLMKICAELGFTVSGSDMAESRELATLQEAGLKAFAGHRKENLPDAEGRDLLVVYSSAIAKENPELLEAEKRGAECILRGNMLGLISSLFPKVIAVSGSHGKTSVSAMIVHILEKLGLHPGYLIGGNLPGRIWNGSAGNGEIFVCEADESDGTHTAVRPWCAVVTNIEDDHVWNFSGPEELLENFRKFALHAPYLVYQAGEKPDLLFQERKDACRIRMEQEDTALLPENLGFYQKINAVTAAHAVEYCSFASFREAAGLLNDFPGVERRLTLHYQGLDHILIEDYAHHPTEVAASLRSLREMYPGHALKVVFQPHRYARLERYFQDFVRIFSEDVNRPEKLYVAPVFAAWTDTGKVGSAELASSVGKNAAAVSGTWENIAGKVAEEAEEGNVIAVIGAGDVHRILAPLKELLKAKDISERTGVVIAAGGSSRRFGENKLFRKLAGLPVFMHCIRHFAKVLPGGRIVLAVPPALRKEYEDMVREYMKDLPGKEIFFADGGACREESVLHGLKTLPQEVKIVEVHDAARPFAGAELLSACAHAAEQYGAAIAAKKVSDTMKEADEEGLIRRTVPREKLWAVQTPQTFRREILEEAFRKAGERISEFTDDSSLVENFTDVRPKLVETRSLNLKITYQEDLSIAEAWLKKNSVSV